MFKESRILSATIKKVEIALISDVRYLMSDFQVLKILEWNKIVVMAFHGYTQR